MKYQLVLQWPASAFEDFDALIAVEDLLIQGLGEDAEVDGHDAGSGEANIFIHTDAPKQTFEEVVRLLRDGESWKSIRVAYRKSTGSSYMVLWPKGLASFSVA